MRAGGMARAHVVETSSRRYTRTRAVRRSIIAAGQEIDAPDFGRQAVEHPHKS